MENKTKKAADSIRKEKEDKAGFLDSLLEKLKFEHPVKKKMDEVEGTSSKGSREKTKKMRDSFLYKRK